MVLVKFEIVNSETLGAYIRAVYDDGHNTVWGKVNMTEQGARRMLTIAAKRWGFTVDKAKGEATKKV